jgi:hypothetical protein
MRDIGNATTTALVLASSLLVCMLLGCGKAEYEKAMNERISGLAFESNFIEGLQTSPTEIISDIAELRLPTFIDERATTFTKNAKNRQGLRIDKRRIQPPGIELPGFRYTYELFVDLGGKNNTHPVYTYFASVPGSEPIQRVTGRIRRGGWEDVSLDTPERQKIQFKKLTVRGSQEFEMDQGGGEIEKKAGQLEIYIHSTPAHHIIIGFRGTNEAAEEVGMFDVVPYSLGTLTVLDDGGGEEDDS